MAIGTLYLLSGTYLYYAKFSKVLTLTYQTETSVVQKLLQCDYKLSILLSYMTNSLLKILTIQVIGTQFSLH